MKPIKTDVAQLLEFFPLKEIYEMDEIKSGAEYIGRVARNSCFDLFSETRQSFSERLSEVMDENAEYRRQNEKALANIRNKLTEIDSLKQQLDAMQLVL